MERKQPGPVGKGPRKQVKVRFPLPLVDALQEVAARQGKTVNDMFGEFAEQVTGVPYDPQGALPMSAA